MRLGKPAKGKKSRKMASEAWKTIFLLDEAWKIVNDGQGESRRGQRRCLGMGESTKVAATTSSVFEGQSMESSNHERDKREIFGLFFWNNRVWDSDFNFCLLGQVQWVNGF